MSYRKVKIGDVQYEYVVGKTHVKVKGIGAFPKEEVGQVVERVDQCECCGTDMKDLYSSWKPIMQLRVTPADVAKLIRSKV